ncbi:MAG: hypothetical protein HQ536_03770 [Parcubacteria group bacterium]|nr:hypothetical protein [Parcubacteria group bacterium]
MKRQNSTNPRTAPDWWEKETKGRRGVILCSECDAVYYDKHWHTNKKYAAVLRGQKGVKAEPCPECKNVKSSSFEGEVALKNLPLSEKKTEILNLVRNVGKRATKRDPEDRIIKIEDKGNTVRILTTENQLAVSIGKQLDSAFKGGSLKIKWSEKNALARVIWTQE